jgi:hypothetical protein
VTNLPSLLDGEQDDTGVVRRHLTVTAMGHDARRGGPDAQT